ncbi:hypothetical protein QCA50_018516 [Cerrena zonata]|uniref:Cytochrome P450 n=1 Tax=Cerrena zonata TaxID=2478898 RepID=A0AAW0FD78_9APHY
MDSITTCAVILASTFLLQWLKKSLWPKLPFPPGPIGYPIIGNMLDVPSVMPWKTYKDWSKVYGDVIFLNLPGSSLVVLGSAQAAVDLLEKRSDIYSDRPISILHQMMSWDWNLAFMPYTPLWRNQRREFHQFFNSGQVSKYQPIQLRECRAFLQRLLNSPSADLGQNIRHVFTAIILKVTYDMDISDLRNEYVLFAQEAVDGLSRVTVPGVYWVEFFPFLRHVPSWVPGTSSRRLTEYYKPIVEIMRDKAFDDIKQDMANGKESPSVAAALLSRLYKKAGEDDANLIDDKVARNVAGLAYAAAADTTTSAGQSFLIAMSLYPDVQRNAQEELDRVVGPNRLPDFRDYDELVYVRAVVLEAMRWMSVAPLGIAHRVTRDDEYRGCLIPKGTIVSANIWAMLNNPEDYPEPEVFNPGRFLKDGRLNPAVRDPLTLAFGFGRRVCPGRYLSNGSLFMMIASILHTFNIIPTIGKDERQFDPARDTVTGLVSAPSYIPCKVVPRSKGAECLINSNNHSSSIREGP